MKQSCWAGISVGTDVAGAAVRQAGQGLPGCGERRGWKTLLGYGFGVALALTAAGCHATSAQGSAAVQVDQNAGDPADANMAPVNGDAGYTAGYAAGYAAATQSAGGQAQTGQDQQPGAPIERRSPESAGQNYSAQADQTYSAPSGQGYDNGQYDNQAQQVQQSDDAYAADLTDVEAYDPPPPLLIYVQPPAPEPDYMWTPGYWYWGARGYYWVPGCWVAAPYRGALWTPGYWGYVGDRYRFHHGFWGLHIGFYGGVDYGYGYVGHGYYGGFWDHDHFRYNTAVNRVNVNVIRNVYVHNVVINNVVVNNRMVNRVSYSGGRGGVNARPMAAEMAVLHEERRAPMASQVQVEHQAAQNRAQFFNQNRGRPAMMVNARPVVADRTPPAVLPTVAVPVGRPGGPGSMQRQGGQTQGWQQRQQQNNGVQVTPGQPQSQYRPGLPQAQEGGSRQPGNAQVPGQPRQPDVRQGEQQQGWQQRQQQNNGVQVTPGQPQSQYRTGMPQTQERGLQRQNTPSVPAQPQQPVQPVQPPPGWQQRQQQNNQVRPTVVQPQPTPGQPQSQYRPGMPQTQERGLQRENRQPQPNQPAEQQRQGWQQRQNNDVRQPQPEVRPVAPVQPRPQEQMRPQQQVQVRPQHLDAPQRPQPQAAPPARAPDLQGHRDNH